MTELVVTLDLDGVTDKAGLMDRSARALQLPDWFGRNWDALADSLSDHTVWPEGAVEQGLLVVVGTGRRTRRRARRSGRPRRRCSPRPRTGRRRCPWRSLSGARRDSAWRFLRRAV
jgi:hypothetical protein